MSKATIKVNREFRVLFKESEKASKSVPALLAKATGYNMEWCMKNTKKCIPHLTEEQKTEIDDIMMYAQIVKQKLWSDFYYNNFPKIKNYLAPPSRIEYNPKKKIVELTDGNEITAKLKQAISDFKKRVGGLTKQRGNADTKPPLNL